MRLLLALLLLSLPLHGQENFLQAIDSAIFAGEAAKAKALIPRVRNFSPGQGTNTNPLVRAVLVTDLEMVSALLDAGTSPHSGTRGASPFALGVMEVPGQRPGDIYTPTHNAFSAAIERDNTNILAILLKKGLPPIPKFSAPPYQLWPMIDDRFTGRVSTANKPSFSNPFSLIHFAIRSGAYASIAYLAERMPLNKKTVETPWFDSGAEWMPQTPALPIDLALREGAFKMVELLLEKGSPPPSPELIASFIPNNCSNPAVVKLIIEAGAKMDKRNKEGQTALGWVTAMLNKEATITEYGEEMGAYEPPNSETEADLRTIQTLLKGAGAKDLGKKGSYDFWMGSDTQYGMFY